MSSSTTTIELKKDFDRARAINTNIVVTPEAQAKLIHAKDSDVLALTITVDSPPTVRDIKIINEESPEAFYNLIFPKPS